MRFTNHRPQLFLAIIRLFIVNLLVIIVSIEPLKSKNSSDVIEHTLLNTSSVKERNATSPIHNRNSATFYTLLSLIPIQLKVINSTADDNKSGKVVENSKYFSDNRNTSRTADKRLFNISNNSYSENVKYIADNNNKAKSNTKCISPEQRNNALNLTVRENEKCAETISNQDVSNDASQPSLDTFKYTNGSAKRSQENEHITGKHPLEMNDASINKSTIAVPTIIHGFHYPGVYRLHRRITPLHKRNGTEMTKTTAANEHSSIPPTSTPKCEKLTNDQKYAKLESVGGRNQQFMANSPEEAGRNFPRLIDTLDTFSHRNEAFDEAPNFADIDDLEFDDELKDNKPVMFDYCDEQCQEIKRKLNAALQTNPLFHDEHQETSTQLPPTKLSSSTAISLIEGLFESFENGEVREEARSNQWQRQYSSGESATNVASENKKRSKIKRKKAGCFLDKFIPVGNCTKNGEEETWGHEKLCTACQGVYMLNDDCFPIFLNSVICDEYDTQCIFDRFTGEAQGKCQTKTLSFKVMRNRGDKECEDWVFEYLDVPVACECYLSKSSWLEAMHAPHESR